MVLMPGREEPLVTGEIYHVFNRGITNQNTFQQSQDYYHFLDTIIYYQKLGVRPRFSYFIRLPISKRNELIYQKHFCFLVDIICYCLMPNHFHLLLKQVSEDGISKFVSLVTNSYSRYFNTKNRRRGPIFQGKFMNVRVENEQQLVHLSRYIHLNPYSSGVVNNLIDLKNYPYSSFSEYIVPKTINACQKGVVINIFKDQEDYCNFVLDQSDNQRQIEKIKHLVLDL